MKQAFIRSSVAVAALALPLAASAQSAAGTNAAPVLGGPPSATPGSGAGLLNDWLRGQSQSFSPWDLGGQFRARLEVKDYFFTPGATPIVPGRAQLDFLRNGGDANDTYLLTRTRLHLGYNADWFHILLEGQDSTSTGDRRNPTLEAEEPNLRQGYVLLGNSANFPLVAKVGRQELIYGEERLIGTVDWNNIGRTFDAVKLRYDTPEFWVDAFTSYPVVPRDNDFNFSNNYDKLSGLYGSSDKLMPWQQSQLYFLARNTSEGSPNYSTGALFPLPSPRDIYTVGFRFKSLPGQLANWDYTAEADYQFGRYAGVTGAAPKAMPLASKDQRAYAAHIDGGYTWAETHWTPRLALEWNYASGSNNTNHHGTFDAMYPSTHLFSGIMDFYSWQNIQDARINFSMKPVPKMTFSASYRGVWLASTDDSFYLSNTAARPNSGTPGGHNGYNINPGYSNFVGTEADAILGYAVTRYATVQLGYGHFFIGDYIKQSLSAFGSTDADYVYLQARINF